MFENVPKKDQKKIVDHLTDGVKPKIKKNGQIKIHELPDGNKVTVRTKSSSTGKLGKHLTVDIDAPTIKSNGKKTIYKKTEIKFVNSKNKPRWN